jgi:inhibitor of cysteine peptidase
MKKMLKALTIFFIFNAIVFAAGCAGKTGNTGNETQGNNDQLEPINPKMPENITLSNTTQVVTEADSGKTISLKKGENFTLNLIEDSTDGYLWKLNLSKGLTILDEEYVEHPNPQHLEGVPGTHAWLIEAVAPGSQKVTGIYKKSGENRTNIEGNFTLNVDVV